MDRRTRAWAGLTLTLALVAPAAGCHNTRSEVPPSKTFSGTGQPPAPLSFGSSPAAPGLSGLPGSGDGLPPGQNSSPQFGTPPPSSGNYGAPTSNTYGPMGNSALATPPASSLGSGMPAMAPSVSNPSVGIPQVGTGPLGPAAGIGAPPSNNTSQAPSPQPF